MIIRRRPKPLILKKYEAIIPRLRPNFLRLGIVQAAADKSRKGYIGEQNVDYHTDLLATKATILYDVCLEVQGKTFQIDSIIITQHAIFILEIKNYDGTITFDTILKQFTSNEGMKETGYRYPITQAELQIIKLQLWLQQHNLNKIPIYYFIAISDPSTIIKVIGDQEATARVVAHGEYIPKKIINMEAGFEDSEKLPHHKIGELILRECKEYDRDIMAEHDIKPRDLLPGVQCPGCRRLGMERAYNNWVCRRCNNHSRLAHNTALRDYLAFIKPWLNNAECREWLMIDSKNIATRIMRNYGLYHDKQRRRWVKRGK